MQHSDSEMPDENLAPAGAGPVSKDDLIGCVAKAIDCGDHRSAGNFLRDALEHFPDDRRLLRLTAKQRKQAERFTHFHSLLKETREAIEDDAFVRAAGAFREAANLSRGFAQLEEAAFGVAVDRATELADRNWRVARSLLEDASQLNCRLIVTEHLWERFRAAERTETIANVLAETALPNPTNLESARARVARTLEQYPGDSGLVNRLTSLDSTIAEKRQWAERQTRLRKLTDLRAALEREEDPAQAGSYIPWSEAAAASHGAEPELKSVLEDIRQQVITCEKAAAALAQDRINDCLEECAWMLSRMRHHRLFLKLKQRAEDRELALADEYSNAVSRIREFLDAGEFAEAAKLCAAGRAKLPQFTDFLDLSREIERRQTEQNRQAQANATSAMRLVEHADSNSRERQFRAAETTVSGSKREQATADPIRRREPAFLKALSIAAAFIAVVGLAYWMSSRKPTALPLQPLRRETAAETKPIPLATPATGSLLIRSEVPGARIFVNGKEYTVSHEPLKIMLSADTYRVSGFHKGYRKFGPVKVAVGQSAETILDVELEPKPAKVEIRGAPPDTRIKLDGVLLSVVKKKVWTKEVAPGDHAIELSRDGYLSKKIVRNLAPGELFKLAGKDVRLESSDARRLGSERQAWNKLGSAASLPALETFLAKYPDGLHAKAARLEIEGLSWQSVDKGNPDALRAFMAKYPASLFANLAKKDYEAALLARAAKAEDNDGSNATRRAPTAANALAQPERKASAAETQSLEEAAWKKVNQRDEASLDSYLRDNPSGRHRSEAESALAVLRPAEDDAVAVLTVISRFASAWNTKDVDSIVAIQKTLKKRAVKAQLSQVKELNVRISPASPPHIQGSQAIVLCRRQASQVLSNGTRKQMPETTVSYVLEKRDGNWTIEGTR